MNSPEEELVTGRLRVNLGALRRNWRWLAEKAGNAETGAAVKANGYGLGLEEIGAALKQAGCRHFFTANTDEGIRLRRVAGDAEIFVLAGVSDENAPYFNESGLIPVLNSPRDIECWVRWCRRAGQRFDCAVHVDTGMNRLGLTAAEAMTFAGGNGGRNSIGICLLMSHLACADEPGNRKNGEQLALFEKIAGLFAGCRKSLANSAGLVLDQHYHFDLTRPGIALYGGAFSDQTGPLEPVAKLEGRILQIRQVKRNETVGYGGVAGADTDRTIAIAGLGYGDGILRSASGAGVPLRQVTGGGHGWTGGYKVPVVGRISMDMTAFDVTRVPAALLESRPWIEFIGENASLDDFANAAGTIAYEVLTGMGSRVSRRYENGPGVDSNG